MKEDDIRQEADILEQQEDLQELDPQESKPITPASLLAEQLYDVTARNTVAGRKWLRTNRPDGISEEALEALLSAVDRAEPDEALHSVRVIAGKKDRYYYDASIMTAEFALLSAMLSDKDILHTIASVTRSDCQMYPRPTEFSKMTGYPFHFTLDEVEGAAARMAMSEEYKDIGVVQASNGEKAFFSSLHMKEGYARALLEGSEVESKLWP